MFRNWVKGYESVLDPINQLSVQFHKTFDGKKVKSGNPTYKETLLYLLLRRQVVSLIGGKTFGQIIQKTFVVEDSTY
jgi:hypothetical protein